MGGHGLSLWWRKNKINQVQKYVCDIWRLSLLFGSYTSVKVFAGSGLSLWSGTSSSSEPYPNWSVNTRLQYALWPLPRRQYRNCICCRLRSYAARVVRVVLLPRFCCNLSSSSSSSSFENLMDVKHSKDTAVATTAAKFVMVASNKV